MDPERFEELVGEALDELPASSCARWTTSSSSSSRATPEDPELLGLYEGVALTDRTSDYGGVLPDRITLYREALVEMCADEDELRDEVAVTVVHEIAHHFGIDDATLHRLGWA